AILAALLYRALGRQLPAFFAALAYAASDEFHQRFVHGRHGTPVDVAIDAVGIVAGLLVWERVRQGPRSPSTSTARSATRGGSGRSGSRTRAAARAST